MISNRRSILTADLDSRFVFPLPVIVENVVAITADMKNHVYYWSDMKLRKIFRNNREKAEIVSILLTVSNNVFENWFLTDSIIIGHWKRIRPCGRPGL